MYNEYNYSSALPSCPSRSEGLVHYPTTQALRVESKSVLARCADNAHLVGSVSLHVICTPSGTWSSEIPQCECDDGYGKFYTVDNRQFCRGISQLFLSF